LPKFPVVFGQFADAAILLPTIAMSLECSLMDVSENPRISFAIWSKAFARGESSG
jgi:prevent-host-death family protein